MVLVPFLSLGREVTSPAELRHPLLKVARRGDSTAYPDDMILTDSAKLLEKSKRLLTSTKAAVKASELRIALGRKRRNIIRLLPRV